MVQRKKANTIYLTPDAMRSDEQMRAFAVQAWGERIGALFDEYGIAPGNWRGLAWSLAIDLHPDFQLRPPKRKPGRKRRERLKAGRPLSWTKETTNGLLGHIDEAKEKVFRERGKPPSTNQVIRDFLIHTWKDIGFPYTEKDLRKAVTMFATQASRAKKP